MEGHEWKSSNNDYHLMMFNRSNQINWIQLNLLFDQVIARPVLACKKSMDDCFGGKSWIKRDKDLGGNFGREFDVDIIRHDLEDC